jgi:hypothetical protein
MTNFLSIIQKDDTIKKVIKEDVEKYDSLCLADQAVLGKNLVVTDKQKTIAMGLMRDELRDQQIQIKVYETKLGRKLTDSEIQQFLSSRDPPAIADEVDEELANKLSRRLQQNRRLIVEKK